MRQFNQERPAFLTSSSVDLGRQVEKDFAPLFKPVELPGSSCIKSEVLVVKEIKPQMTLDDDD